MSSIHFMYVMTEIKKIIHEPIKVFMIKWLEVWLLLPQFFKIKGYISA